MYAIFKTPLPFVEYNVVAFYMVSFLGEFVIVLCYYKVLNQNKIKFYGKLNKTI